VTGTIRPGPPLSGTLSEGEVRAIAPMDNEIYAGPIDGADLRGLFRDGVREVDAVPEVVLHVSGAQLRWERTEAECRLVAATVDGAPIDPERTYRVASEAYTFWAPGFPSISHQDASPVGHVQDALLQHVRDEGLPRETEGRMVAVSDAVDDALTLR